MGEIELECRDGVNEANEEFEEEKLVSKDDFHDCEVGSLTVP